MTVGINRSPVRGPRSNSAPPSTRRGRPSRAPELRVVPRRPGRRPVMAVASIALIATCCAVFALIYLHSTRLVAVIGVSRVIPQGQSVEAVDLRQVDISSASGVNEIPVTAAQEVIGRPAAVTLFAGTLLSPSDIGGGQKLLSTQAIVGVDLKPGMLPASGVTPGESVLVVLTGPAGSPVSTDEQPDSTGSASSTTTTTLAAGSSSSNATESTESTDPTVITNATVVGVNSDPDDSGTGDITVSVEVPAGQAPLIADASAAGQAALVQVGGSS